MYKIQQYYYIYL